MTHLHDLYTQFVGSAPTSIEELPSSGSNRRYFRLKGEKSIIGVLGTCKEENEAFLYMSEHFHKKGLPVPEIYAISDDTMAYIQEDLGDTLLFNAIEKGRKTSVFSDEEKTLLVKTIRLLPDMQFLGADEFNFSKAFSKYFSAPPSSFKGKIEI